MGIGASLNFIAGTQRRAPKLWQKLRLEFMFHLLSQPKRLATRYYQDWRYYRRLMASEGAVVLKSG